MGVVEGRFWVEDGGFGVVGGVFRGRVTWRGGFGVREDGFGVGEMETLRFPAGRPVRSVVQPPPGAVPVLLGGQNLGFFWGSFGLFLLLFCSSCALPSWARLCWGGSEACGQPGACQPSGMLDAPRGDTGQDTGTGGQHSAASKNTAPKDSNLTNLVWEERLYQSKSDKGAISLC